MLSSTWGRWHCWWKERGQESHITNSSSSPLLQMLHSSSFFWLSYHDRQESHSVYTHYNYLRDDLREKLLDLKQTNKNKGSGLFSNSLKELMNYHCSCRAKMNEEWRNGVKLINTLTMSSLSGLHRLQWHSNEWILRIFVWNRQIICSTRGFMVQGWLILWLFLSNTVILSLQRWSINTVPKFLHICFFYWTKQCQQPLCGYTACWRCPT